jgi:hypothetical protein
MLTIPLLLIALIIPALFWFYGKRMLGNQTHPAALFILAWMASSLVLSMVDATAQYYGKLALLWVSVNLAIFALVRKFKPKPDPTSRQK